MANRAPLDYPVFQAFDANGDPLVKGQVEFFDAGTTNNRDTYSDPDLTTTNPNPVTLNSRGEPESGGGTPINIYLDNQPYKIVLKDSSGSTIRTVDNYIDSSPITVPQDPADAADQTTDVYEITLSRDPQSDEVFTVDFTSANTTTTPTLENTNGSLGALTLKTRDGNTLWVGAVNGVHEIEYDGTDYLILDPNRTEIVDSVSDLRSNSWSGARLWLQGYYGVGTAGGGPLYRDSSDTTTADNGGTTFVDADGVRWKRTEDGVIYINWFEGSSLNAKWDNFRATLTKGYRYSLVIPPPEPNETGAVEDGTGRWVWAIDAPMQFDDPENLGSILWMADCKVTAGTTIAQALLFGPTNKTEDTYFPLGIPRINCDSKATAGIEIKGASRLIFGSQVKITDCADPVKITDTTATTSQIRFNELYVARWDNATVLLDGTSVNAVTDIRVDRIFAEAANSTSANGVVIKGNVSRYDFPVIDIRNPTNQLTNGVLIQANSAGRPRFVQNIGTVDVTATTGIKAEDTTGGSASKITGLKIGYIMVQGGTVAADLDWCDDPVIEDWFPSSRSITIGANTFGARFDEIGSFTGTLTGTSTTDTGTIKYTRKGRTVTLDIPEIKGTSDSTALTITGAPSNITPQSSSEWVPVRVVDNGSTQSTHGIVKMNTNGTLDFRKDAAGATFTNSGDKGVGASSITYDLQ